jgi:REP-associated tyrosine transposase
MPRKRRGWQPGACYHITHRCHNREFLFHYAKYRNFYTRTLFKEYSVTAWTYWIIL